ncbi:MAG: HEAT repeat domain-containing protein [Nitrospinae bacterium]|nr:HEAT repeat domain-containing protein [Nitrospinota bacterium]
MMDIVYRENTDLIVRFALGIGVAALAMTVLMIVSILLMRGLFLSRDRQRQEFMERWRPVFVEALFQPPGAMPLPRGEERLYFLYLFNHYHSLMKGENREQLNRLADAAGIRSFARGLIRKGNMPRRIVASYALGFMKDESVFDALIEGASDENTLLSQAAATAAVQIDPVRAVPLLLPKLLHRADWPVSNIDTLLAMAGEEAVSPVLRESIMNAAEKEAPNLIRLLGSASEEAASACIGYWLERAREGETISACLQMLKDAHYLPLVRSYTKHPTWYLRLQAVATLGRIGHRNDVAMIVGLLADKEWWVRYRAASVLADMPFLTHQEVTAIRDAQTDRYARDVMDTVMMERGR